MGVYVVPRRKLTDAEIEAGYRFFAIESEIESSQHTLKGARLAQQQSMRMVAARLGISTPTYHELEKNSAKGAISIRQLRKAAAALECDVVISLVLKNGHKFDRDIWEKLLPFALSHPATGSGPNRVPGRHLAAIVLEDCLPHPEVLSA